MNFTYDVVFIGTRAMRIAAAKQYLLENSTETMTSAARIFKIATSTLHSSMKHDKDIESGVLSSSQKGGQNKVLAKHEADAVHEFIRSLLSYGIPPTHELVFAAISALKLAEKRDAPSRRWFQQ